MANPHLSLFKALFREAVYRFGHQSAYRTSDIDIPVALEPIKNKWIYVFVKSSSQSDAYRLYLEVFFDAQGDCVCVNLEKCRGTDDRKPGSVQHNGFLIPMPGKGGKARIYALVSQIQLRWERIHQLEADPSLRCYALGDTIGGITKVPNNASDVLYDVVMGKSQDAQHDEERSCVIVGLFDYLAEAKRKCESYENACKDYLNVRFDSERDGFTDDEMERRRMKKYAAALVYNSYLTNNPEAKEYRECLKRNGWELEDYLNQENQFEWNLKQKAEQSGAALAGWMARDAFESTLLDYSVSGIDADTWHKIEEQYFALLRNYSSTSMMTKYFHDFFDDEKSWVREYLFNADRFSKYRKSTQALVEVLGNMAEYVVKEVEIKEVPEFLTKHVAIWFEDVSVEWGERTAEKIQQKFLMTLSTAEPATSRKLTVVKKVVKNETVKKVIESKVWNGLLLGIEVVNMGIAVRELIAKRNLQTGLSFIGSAGDFTAALFEISKKVGKAPIAALGAVSGAIDTALSIREGAKEWDEGKGHYDAAVAKYISAGGVGISTVGYAWITGAATMGAIDAIAAGEAGVTIFNFGIGMSAAALGVPVAGWVVAAGLVMAAAGSALYFKLHKEGVKKWLVESEWGEPDALEKVMGLVGISSTKGEWNFDSSSDFGKRVAELNEFVYTVKCEVWYSKLSNTASIRFKSPFFSDKTKIDIEELALEGDNKQIEVVASGYTVQEGASDPRATVDVQKTSDVLCNVDVNFGHRTNLPNVAKVKSRGKVDLFGNGRVVFETIGVDKDLIG